MRKQRLIGSIAAFVITLAAAPVLAESGFYGGVSLRDADRAPLGLTLGKLPLAWARFTPPAGDDTGQRSLVFGGYRWKSDVAVEATFNSVDNYSLSPGALARVGGVGLGLSDPATRSWNADVYTSWEVVKNLSLYGRLGYAQSDVRPLLQSVPSGMVDVRRLHDGVNYGVGLRYAMTTALGLRVEYSRLSRFGPDVTTFGVLPDADQVTIGVQFRF